MGIPRRLGTLLFLIGILPTFVWADGATNPPLGISNQGGTASYPVYLLDCEGGPLTCSQSGSTGTITFATSPTLTGNLTISKATPTITLSDTGSSGKSFEFYVKAGTLYAANSTDNITLIAIGPNNAVYLPQTTSCTTALITAPDGKIYCGPAAGGSGTVTSITQGTGMSFSVSPITTTGTINLATPVTVGNGGTGAATFTLNGVLYGNAASALNVTSQGGSNTVLTANAGAPTFSSTPTIGTLTLSQATPSLTLTDTGTGGTSFEWNVKGPSAYFADATNNKQYLAFNTGNTAVYLPQILSCKGSLATGADGKTFCQTDPSFTTLTLTGTGQSTITKGLVVASGLGTASTDIFTVGFHQNFKGTIPVLSACGTTPTIATGSTDNAGVVTIGTGVTTSCTVTFGTTFTTAPACTAGINSTAITMGVSTTPTVLTITSSADMASKVVPYICMGING